MSTSEEIKSSVPDTTKGASALFTTTPTAVVRDVTMTIEEKRSLLASWASDARQVPDRPALRRLDNGCLVEIDDVLDALEQLDESSSGRKSAGRGEWPHRRSFGSKLAHMWRRRRADDDDDPPTPAPAAMRPRPPILEGGAAAAVTVAA